MRSTLIYEVNIFWTDQTPVNSVQGSYTEDVVKSFLVHKTIEKVKELPTSIQSEVLNRLVKD